jgi:hypothetical protein
MYSEVSVADIDALLQLYALDYRLFGYDQPAFLENKYA